MGVLDKGASALLTVVHALALLRPGSRRRDGDGKLRVTLHQATVGRNRQGSYVATVRYGKHKEQTVKRRSDMMVWDKIVHFSWTPTDPLVIVKIRKAKRCKDTTIAGLSIDVEEALKSGNGLPDRKWLSMERTGNDGRKTEDVLIQVTVEIEGVRMESVYKQGKDPAKPSAEKVQKEMVQKVQGQDTATTEKSVQTAPDVAEFGTQTDNCTDKKTDVKDDTATTLDKACQTEAVEGVKELNTGATVSEIASSLQTLWEGLLANRAQNERLIALANSLRHKLATVTGSVPPTAGDVALNPTSTSVPSTQFVTTLDPAAGNTTCITKDRGDAHLQVTQGEGTDPDTDSEEFEATALSRKTSWYEEVMITVVENLWEELKTKRASAGQLLARANSLRAELAATVPRVLQSVTIRKMAAKLPDSKPYVLADINNMSVEEMEENEDILMKLIEDEDKRTSYIRRYIERLSTVARIEAH